MTPASRQDLHERLSSSSTSCHARRRERVRVSSDFEISDLSFNLWPEQPGGYVELDGDDQEAGQSARKNIRGRTRVYKHPHASFPLLVTPFFFSYQFLPTTYSPHVWVIRSFIFTHPRSSCTISEAKPWKRYVQTPTLTVWLLSNLLSRGHHPTLPVELGFDCQRVQKLHRSSW